MNNQKLLLIGFSCTDTDDGYAAFLKEELAATHPNMEVERCALGGLAPPVIPATLKQILIPEACFTHAEDVLLVKGERNRYPAEIRLADPFVLDGIS